MEVNRSNILLMSLQWEMFFLPWKSNTLAFATTVLYQFKSPWIIY